MTKGHFYNNGIRAMKKQIIQKLSKLKNRVTKSTFENNSDMEST